MFLQWLMKTIVFILSEIKINVLLSLNHLKMVVIYFWDERYERTSYILGVKIHRDCSHKLVTLLQEHYIKNILEWFNMQDCNPIDTPFARCENLRKEMGPKTPKEKGKITNVPYSGVVGSLMYATMCTKLYIFAMLLGWWVVTKKILEWCIEKQ